MNTICLDEVEKVTKSWGHLYRYKRKIKDRYPRYNKIRLAKKILNVILPYLNNNCSILDIGAFDRLLETSIKYFMPGAHYKSVDLDGPYKHDYDSIDKVKEKFDIVLVLETLEHMAFKRGVDLLSKIHDFLNPNGILILSIPNIFHPNRCREYSHKVDYRYDELGGILLALGYKVEDIFRLYNDPLFRKIFKRYILRSLFYLFEVDFARSIVIVAKNE